MFKPFPHGKMIRHAHHNNPCDHKGLVAYRHVKGRMLAAVDITSI